MTRSFAQIQWCEWRAASHSTIINSLVCLSLLVQVFAQRHPSWLTCVCVCVRGCFCEKACTCLCVCVCVCDYIYMNVHVSVCVYLFSGTSWGQKQHFY